MRNRFGATGAWLVIGCAILATQQARADEGGVSFWVPGFFGSLAAVPGQPGFALATIYYHTSVSAGGGKVFPRGRRLEAGLDADADLLFVAPSYTFATPVFGARAQIALLGAFGHMRSSIDATVIGPGGGVLSGTRSDSLTGFGDLVPQANLKWNQGVHNYMWYVTGDIPVGAYNPNRIANLGIGHGAIDSGFGYTYFNPQTGWEASAVLGFTYNFKNPDTDYRNGIDGHLDWAVSRFLSPQLQVGVVGYLFQQVTGDSGSGATLGDFKSRVAGIGPQIGYLFPIAGMQGYVNLKGYAEFGAENRPEGWNVWLTLAISPSAPPPAAASRLVRK